MNTTYAEMMGRTQRGVREAVHFLGAHAALRLQGQLLQCALRQRFFNPPNKDNVEITYTCPLPFGAVLLGVDVLLNDKPLKGEVKKREAARDQYEASIDKGDSAFLVAVNPDGSVSMELGNLLAGETCEITLHYAQVLQTAQGSLRVLLPTTIAPRYGDAVKDGGFAPHSAPHACLGVEYPFTVNVRVEGELARSRISSPSHALGMRMDGGAMSFTLASQAWLDRDLVLLLEEVPAGGVAVVAPDVLEPDESVVLACLTPQLEQPLAPRALKLQLLVDCSGSMAGSSIESARLALQQIVQQLQPQDQFSLSRFGSDVMHCHRRLVSVEHDQRSLALEWVAELQANMGGTEMEAAIVSTVKLARGKASDLLLVTDGDIHAVDSLIQQLQRQSHRCFVVGIGSSPAEAHLRRMAEATGGACEFVAPGEAVQAAIARMFARLRSVRISELALQLPPEAQVMAVELLPRFAFIGDQVQAFIRIRGAWPQEAALQLRGALDGEDASVKPLASCVPQPIADADNTLARMAAHAVCLQAMCEQAATAQAGITELAVRYQLITEHTHFVLSHERDADSAATQSPRLVTTPNMLAAGFGGMAAACVRQYSRQGSDDDLGFGATSMPFVWRTARKASVTQTITPQQLVAALRALPSTGHLTRFEQLRQLGLPRELAQALKRLLGEAKAVQAFIRWLLQCEQAQWCLDASLQAEAQRLGMGREWTARLSADHWRDPAMFDVGDLEIPAFLRKQAD